MIFRRSDNVPRLAHYSEYRDLYLRPDFYFRCAYCLTPEFYFLQGDGGEIDHFRPLNPPTHLGLDFSNLANDYSNLYWSCGRCNSAKGNNWPTVDQLESGQHFVDPCEEDHDAHWQLNPDGTVRAITTSGRYTVDVIRLNRKRLVWLRSYLRNCNEQIERIGLILKAKKISPEVRNLLLDQIQILRDIVDPPVIAR